MQTQTRSAAKRARFEQATLPHLDAAYNLARWLTRNDQDAEDMVQESYLRAFKFFDSFHGGDSRAWLLAIVRNTCYTWLQQNRAAALDTPFDDEIVVADCESISAERQALEKVDYEALRQALDELPLEFREMMALRAVEGLSYKEIAFIASVPLGTVMSRLARARQRLQQAMSKHMSREG